MQKVNINSNTQAPIDVFRYGIGVNTKIGNNKLTKNDNNLLLIRIKFVSAGKNAFRPNKNK